MKYFLGKLDFWEYCFYFLAGLGYLILLIKGNEMEDRFKFKFVIEDNDGKVFITKEYDFFKDIKEDNLIYGEKILDEAEEEFPYGECYCLNESNSCECSCPSRFNDGKVKKMLQCTGLKNKNGKFIYDKYYLHFEDKIFKVDYDKDNARFIFLLWMCEDEFDEEEGREIVEEYDSVKEFLMNCEIIGNEFENPELLKKYKNNV